jgi:hypothetical protein
MIAVSRNQYQSALFDLFISGFQVRVLGGSPLSFDKLASLVFSETIKLENVLGAG